MTTDLRIELFVFLITKICKVLLSLSGCKRGYVVKDQLMQNLKKHGTDGWLILGDGSILIPVLRFSTKTLTHSLQLTLLFMKINFCLSDMIDTQ